MTTNDRHVPQVVFACARNGGRSVISRVLTEPVPDLELPPSVIDVPPSG